MHIRSAKQICIMCILEAIYNDVVDLNLLYNEIKKFKKKEKRDDKQNLELNLNLKLIEEKHQLFLKKKKNLFSIRFI